MMKNGKALEARFSLRTKGASKMLFWLCVGADGFANFQGKNCGGPRRTQAASLEPEPARGVKATSGKFGG